MFIRLTYSGQGEAEFMLNANQVVSLLRTPRQQFTTVTCLGGGNPLAYTVRETPTEIANMVHQAIGAMALDDVR